MTNTDTQHVKQLAKELDVDLYWGLEASITHLLNTNRAYMALCATENQVLFSGVNEDSPNVRRETFLNEREGWDDDIYYFVALHELGHQALDHVLMDKTALNDHQVAHEEARAWIWALNTAKRSPAPKTWKEIKKALNSYRHEAKRND